MQTFISINRSHWQSDILIVLLRLYYNNILLSYNHIISFT